MRGRRWIGLWAVLTAVAASAQDVHFSQMDFNPVLLNAAYAGFVDGGGRVGAACRTQWASVSHPYRTFALTADALLWRDRYRRNGAGGGVAFVRDKAGTLDYGTTSAIAMVSYNRALDWNGVHHLALGAEAGFHLRGYDASRATLFDDAEQLLQRELRYVTVGCGLAWSCDPDESWWLRVGVAAHNLNRPSLSLLEGDGAHLEPRYLMSARVGYRLGGHWELSPVALAQIQHGNSEFCYGADVRWRPDGDDGSRRLSLAAGIAVRHGDACLLSVSAEYHALQVIFCYDANTSALAEASSGYGAVELGVVYRFVKQRVQQRRALPCPIM